MLPRPFASASPRAARFARIALVWLAMAMAMAQLVAARHAYSHVPGEVSSQSGSKHSGGLAPCDTCICAVALSAGAPPASAVVIVAITQQPALPVAATIASIAPQQRPYAIRAPPSFAG